MIGQEGSEHFMLYIQWGRKVDNDYIRLAAFLGRFDITLVPVKPEELDYFLVKRQVPVLMVTKSISQYKAFQKVREESFDFFLSTGKIRLFHFNSFKEEPSYLFYKQKQNYINVPLPLSLKQITRFVLSHYIRFEGDEKWPGGRRSRLPQMGGDL